MTNLPTRETLEAMVEAIYAEAVRNADNDIIGNEALVALDQYAGVCTAANPHFGEALGPDFICALDDGTVAAWGGDIVLASGVIGRELSFISPADQIVETDADAAE